MRRMLNSILLTLIFVVVSGGGAAWAAGAPAHQTVGEVVAAIEQAYGDARALSADFVQITRSESLGDEQRQRGRVMMMRPRKMRWDFKSPDNKLFVTDGETMWVWSEAENQVIVYQDFADNTVEMASLLTDLGKLDDLFEITLVEDPEKPARNAYVLRLDPQKEGNVDHILLHLSHRKLEVQKVIIRDEFGTETELQFSRLETNPEVADDAFTFSIPEGAEVIRPESF